MTKRKRQTNASPRPASHAIAVIPKRHWQILVALALLIIAANVILFRSAVPLGCPGRFTYPYSPALALRLKSLILAVLPVIALATAVSLTCLDRKALVRLGLTLAAIAGISLGVWSYFAPPSHFNQHIFNANSPAQDGAFVSEAIAIDSVRNYLAHFPDRARQNWEQLRGTRVISNPPGPTILAWTARQALDSFPALRPDIPISKELYERSPATAHRAQQQAAVGLAFFWLCTALWLAAGPVLYALARLHLPPSTSLVFAICCLFTPMTLGFTPGKDAAQLLTIALPLWLWLRAIQRNSHLAAIAAGAFTLLGCLMSLVHIWIAAIIIVAAFGPRLRDWRSLRQPALHALLPAAIGCIATAALLYPLLGLNVIDTFRAVAAAQASVTRGPDAMPLVWQVLGIPLFLLFAGAGWWILTTWLVTADRTQRLTDDPARFGRWLLLTTLAALLLTVGFTNVETPRLWIPFVPLWLLAVMLQLRLTRTPARPAAPLLATLVLLHLGTTLIQWSLMDMRETENRIAEQAFYDRPDKTTIERPRTPTFGHE